VYGAVNYDPWGKPRIGDWIQTRSGRKFHLLDPRPEDFGIWDIAHALSNQCRFTGHPATLYSVAEHSVRVARRIAQTHPDIRPQARRFGPPKTGVLYGDRWGSELAYDGLMHDATEAYLCDMARPFKQLPEFAVYRDLEDKLMKQIAFAFEVQYPFHPAIKQADEVLLGTEARDLMAPTPEDWHFRYEHLPERVRPWSPRKAKRLFLKSYLDLRTRMPGHSHKPSLRMQLYLLSVPFLNQKKLQQEFDSI
jgi:hypothetical protein